PLPRPRAQIRGGAPPPRPPPPPHPRAPPLAAGLTPFLIGDALKAALAMGALPAAWKLVGRKG
ncbi:hypothetical protein ACFV5C_37920, partial [Streptomyces sp. NPDC059762]